MRSQDVVTRGFGYPTETLTVTTEDGYKLDVFHILGRGSDSGNTTGATPPPPVLLAPGIFCNAAAWILNANKSLRV